MPTLFDRIQAGIVTGAALWIGGTGCSTALKVEMASDADIDAQTMNGDAATDARVPDAHTPDANTPDASTTDARVIVDGSADAGLQPYPLSALSCSGPDAAIWCCHSASCEVFEGSCPPVDELPPSFPTGSPECGLTGPFAPNPEDPNVGSGNCCYVVGYQVIEGRPLFVDHAMIVASIVMRADWLPA